MLEQHCEIVNSPWPDSSKLRPDVLFMMCDRDPKSGAPLPDELLLPEIATFFFAGEDTTSHTGAWTLCDPLPLRSFSSAQ